MSDQRAAAFLRDLTGADVEALARRLSADPGAATAPLEGVQPLLVLLRRSRSSREAVRACACLLLDAGADPNSRTTASYGQVQTALLAAVWSDDLPLARLLIDRGAVKDQESYETACSNEEFNDPDNMPFYDLLK
jgi:ankyrin repeat protein